MKGVEGLVLACSAENITAVFQWQDHRPEITLHPDGSAPVLGRVGESPWCSLAALGEENEESKETKNIFPNAAMKSKLKLIRVLQAAYKMEFYRQIILNPP
ncbi:Hypothetical predicted protein [Podarcis lilfordi]|uniref:Uncharacterized protein n=1 Tax=Podarcis lilfordi TaxID=74358 RepID=A0AA35K521_9SAUR|nr:Hypothetical predicted protein [Podarcis lilfordi]